MIVKLKVIVTSGSGQQYEREVEAELVLPGLAVSRALFGPKCRISGKVRTWDLTHVATGLRIIGDFCSKVEAVKIAKKYLAGVDWTVKDKDEIIRTGARAFRTAKLARDKGK